MATRLLSKQFKVAGVLTNATTVKLSDPTATYGVKETVSGNVVVADATAMTNSATGVYEYSFTDTVDIAYTAYFEVVYAGATYRFEEDVPARASSSAMVASYTNLLERVGHFLYGLRTGYSADQTSDIEQCIEDGLKYVYASHTWSFFRPVKDISTTAPYTTGTVTIALGVVTLAVGTFPTWAADGLLKVSNSYYSIATRDSTTQVTLDDLTVAVAAGTSYELGRPEIPLDDSFEDMAGDRTLAYYPDQNELYPPVQNRHDQAVRVMQQDDPFYDRPVYYSIRTVEFDATVGSRRRLAFYPTPDAIYVLRAPMILRPVSISAGSPYPVGGEMLSLLILEACLMAAELNFDEMGNRHTDLYTAMLPFAIRDDQERSSPTRLGSDAPMGEGYHAGVYDSDHWARAIRMGGLTLDAVNL